MTGSPATVTEGRTTGPFTLDRRPDGVAVVTVDYAASRMTHPLRARRAGAARGGPRADHRSPRAVVLTGAADAVLGERIRAAYDAFEAIPRVTIAAISGYCLGAGLELVQTCAFRFADPGASFASRRSGSASCPAAAGRAGCPG
jgi:hypothetical protein